MSMDDSNPPSPGVGPPDAEDDDVAKASQNASQRASPTPVEEALPRQELLKQSKYEDREFFLFYQKKWYKVPPEHVVFDMGRPFHVGSGEAAHKLHESKSHQAWLDAGVHTRHLIKLKAEAGGKVQVGFYVTFKVAEDESADIYIIRNLHKTISKKFFDSWVAPADKGGWSAEKQEGKFKELVLDEPSDEGQINPNFYRYEVVPEPTNVLYCRAKKEKAPRKECPVPDKGSKAHTNKRAKPSLPDPPEADEADDTSSAAQSTALLSVQQPITGMSSMGGSPGGTNFFMQTPGMVTISEAWLQQLLSNQRS